MSATDGYRHTAQRADGAVRPEEGVAAPPDTPQSFRSSSLPPETAAHSVVTHYSTPYAHAHAPTHAWMLEPTAVVPPSSPSRGASRVSVRRVRTPETAVPAARLAVGYSADDMWAGEYAGPTCSAVALAPSLRATVGRW